MKTGDIILISGKSEFSQAIQKFQTLQDSESGKWNHSGLILVTPNDTYIVHAYYIDDSKIKSAIVIDKLSDFQNDKYELKLIEHDRLDIIKELESEMLRHVGKPYGYGQLVIIKPIQILFGKYLGRKKNTDSRFVCHEFVQTVWHDVAGIFDEYWEGNVNDIYYNKSWS